MSFDFSTSVIDCLESVASVKWPVVVNSTHSPTHGDTECHRWHWVSQVSLGVTGVTGCHRWLPCERHLLQRCNVSWCWCADGNGVQIHEVAHTMLITTHAQQHGSGQTSTWWTTFNSSNRCVRTAPLTTSPVVLYTQHKLWLVMIRLDHFLKAGVSYRSLFTQILCFLCLRNNVFSLIFFSVD